MRMPYIALATGMLDQNEMEMYTSLWRLIASERDTTPSREWLW